MGKICGFDDVSYPESSMESSMGMMEQAMRVDQGSAIWDREIPDPGFCINQSQIPIPEPRFSK